EASNASIAGCGRLSWKATSFAPFTTMSATLSYQLLRGFLRNEAFALPINRSKVHFTSAEVNGLPSCHFTPSRSLKVSLVLSSFHDQLVASSGTIDSMLFCATSCL